MHHDVQYIIISQFSVAVAKGPVDLQESWWRGLVDAYQDYQNVMG